MTGLLICAAVVALVGALLCFASGVSDHLGEVRLFAALGLALIAVALWLAYAAGGT